ncbi:MAG: motility associated factor glycosyltransferase family protein, partial [Treponema sp.]|nr:motility associated factor glycosyltransferase family protein [Treponema sp.]
YKAHNIPFYLFNEAGLSELNSALNSLCSNGYIRRAIRIDFSGGSQFNSEKYQYLMNTVTGMTGTFWKNRITLSKMGKLYATNVFRNLINLCVSPQADTFYNKVSCPILVCGAGEGLDGFDWKDAEKKYFIIAVDAALSALRKRNIKADAVICVESQLAIEKAFTGIKADDTLFFLDLSSHHGLGRLSQKAVYFSTRYSDTQLLSGLKERGIINDFFNPNGSVGLTAVELALKLRKDESVPVLVLGLDFSYSAGKTHARGTYPHINSLAAARRNNPEGRYDEAFGENSISENGKNSGKVYTTRILSSYADSFRNTFSREQNLYDVSKTGLPLNIPEGFSGKADQKTCLKTGVKPEAGLSQKIKAFYREQKQELKKAEGLLKDGEKSIYRDTGFPLEDQLKSLLETKDYLWLHFPDGTAFSMELSFLKRIRTEISFFIKQIDIAVQD